MYVQLVIRMACSYSQLGPGDLPRENGLFLLYPGLNTIAGRLVSPGHGSTMTIKRHVPPFKNAITSKPIPYQLRSIMGFFSKSPSNPWTPNSFPGGKSSTLSPMLFGPVLPGSPYVGVPPAMAIPTLSPMVVSMQMQSPVQAIPITVQQPTPPFQAIPLQVTPPTSFAVLQPPPPPPPPPPPHVPSPVIPSPPQVFHVVGDDHLTSSPVGMLVSTSPQHHAQQQRSPGNVTVNLYVKSPERRSRELCNSSPSPSHWQQLQEHQQQQEYQHQVWQQEQKLRQEQWQRDQDQRLCAWQQAQQLQRLQWEQAQQRRRVILDTNVTVPVPISVRQTLSPAR
jgi:hypothetical protein